MRRPKVCILVRENVSHWAPLYVEAFREVAEVITVGPVLNRALLELLKLGHTTAFLEPNDYTTETDDAVEALAVLPAGWLPDLVIGINSSGPAYRNIRRIACPTAYISVDTWHEPGEFLTARPYDFVFAAQQALVQGFRDAGCRHAEWLPLACAPRRHFPVQREKLFDIVFVGSTLFVVNEQRVARLTELSRQFNVGMKYGLTHEEMSQIFGLGKIAFNSSIAQDVNMRVFETLAMGLPLLTNGDASANGLLDLFEDGGHLVTYTDDTLRQRAADLLNDEAARRRIAHRGREEVLALHTYRHRAEQVLSRALPDGGVEEERALLRPPGRPSSYLPHGAKTVLDIGRCMDHSRVVLRRLGVEQFLGMPGGQTADTSRGFYDRVVDWPCDQFPVESIDAIAWKDPLRFCPRLVDALAYAHALLVPGGTLILLLDDPELRSMGDAEEARIRESFERANYFLALQETVSGRGEVLLLLQKAAAPLHVIAREMYRRFPGGQLSTTPAQPGAPAPGSPPAASPSP